MRLAGPVSSVHRTHHAPAAHAASKAGAHAPVHEQPAGGGDHWVAPKPADLAAAWAVYEAALETGTGQHIDFLA